MLILTVVMIFSLESIFATFRCLIHQHHDIHNSVISISIGCDCGELCCMLYTFVSKDGHISRLI